MNFENFTADKYADFIFRMGGVQGIPAKRL